MWTRGRAWAAAAVVLSTLGLGAAAVAPSSPARRPPTPAGPAVDAPVDVPFHVAVEAAPVTLALTGDVHGEPPIGPRLVAGETPFAGTAAILNRADLTVVNLETAVGVRGAPAAKQYTFQAPAQLWGALALAGVDVVSLANNHSLDYGTEALRETIAGARRAGIRVVGAGRNAAEAYAPAVFEIRGRTVAVLGLSRVLPTTSWGATPDGPGLASAYDTGRSVAAVRAAAAKAEHVVVAVHWGDEYRVCPNGEQRTLADALVRAGADVVAGHHPHVLQGIQRRGGAVVAYSLGNFVFYAKSGEARSTGILRVTFTGEAATPAFVAGRIDGDGRPLVLEGREREQALATVAARSPGGNACSW